MKRRQLALLLGTLVALLLIAYLTGVFDSEISTVSVPDVSIPASEVHTVRLTEPRLALQKEGGEWRLTEPVASDVDSGAVARFLEDLSALSLESVVSTNPDRYERYGVDSSAAQVSVGWDGGEQSLIVGNRGPDFRSNYVRLSGDDAVYLTDGSIDLPDEVGAWRDKVIVDIPPETVSSVSIDGPESAYVVEWTGRTWSLTEGGTSTPADSAAVVRYLSRFQPFEADGFLDARPTPSDSTIQLHFLHTAGAEDRIIELTPVGDDYAVTVDGRETVFRLSAARLSQVAPEASHFTE